MKLSIKTGVTSQSINVFIQNSSSTTGAGLTGFAPAAGSLLSGMICYYSFTGTSAASVAQALSVPAAVNSAFAAGQIVELDATHMPGWARLDLPNAALAGSSGRCVSLLISGGTNVAPCPIEIELTGWDNQLVPGAAGGMFIAGTNAATVITTSLTTHLIGTVDTVTTVTNQLTAAQIATGVWQDATSTDFTTTSSIGKSLYTSGNAPGAASGLLISTSLVSANMTQILGTAVSTPATSGVIDVNVKNIGGTVTAGAAGYVGVDWGHVNAPTTTVGLSGTTVGTVTTLTNNATKKNVALPTFEFLMTDSTLHAPATGKTVTCTRSVDGGAFGAGTLANTAELSNGIYKVDFATGDLNGGVITLRATASGCDDTFVTIVTTP